jgi:hypothetical protein
MTGFVKGVVADRLSGGRPSALRAAVTAVAAGAAIAGVTYKALRAT